MVYRQVQSDGTVILAGGKTVGGGGEKGDPGPPGPKGDTGDRGLKGDTGGPGIAGIVVVLHGTDPAVARPVGAMVHWVGTALPADALPYDFWTKVDLP